MSLYLKLGILVYCLIPLAAGLTVSQLQASSKPKGDYVHDIKNGPVKRGGYYNISMPPSPVFTLRQSLPKMNFHHNLLIESGKVMIFKECAVDMEQDPTENACQTIWAYI